MLPKRIISAAMLMIAFCVQGVVLCRADDLQAAIHVMVGPPEVLTKGPRWEADKKTLAGYSPEQLVQALIAEVDLDRGSPDADFGRDVAVYDFFRALDLPPALICQELDKPSLPERKASLMLMLRHANKPEVVQALLRQLGDRRPVNGPEMMSLEAGMKTHQFRVCDDAYNTLVVAIDAPSLKLNAYGSDKGRDKTIQERLAELKLIPPQ